MKLKQAILTIMDRDTLKAVVEDLEIEGVDRRSVDAMRAGVSRSRRAEPEMLLAHLSEKQVKAVCEQMAISPKGRRKELMERFLGMIATLFVVVVSLCLLALRLFGLMQIDYSTSLILSLVAYLVFLISLAPAAVRSFFESDEPTPENR